MGYVLGLAHLVNILYGRERAGLPEPGRSGLDHLRQAERHGPRLAAREPDLYFEIQHLNANAPALAEILSAVASGDRDSFLGG